MLQIEPKINELNRSIGYGRINRYSCVIAPYTYANSG